MRYRAIFRLLSVGPRRSSERTELRLHRLLTDGLWHDSQHGNIAGELRTETRRPDLTRALSLETITTVAIYTFVPTKHVAPATCRNVNFRPRVDQVLPVVFFLSGKDCADAHLIVDLIPDVS